MFRLELEYRQFHIYIFIILLFYYLTGYFLTFLYLIIWIMAPLEELDPDEVEFEEELWPFIEYTYIETNWNKGKQKIKAEFYKLEKEDEKFVMENLNFSETQLLILEEQLKLTKILTLNDINLLKSIYI